MIDDSYADFADVPATVPPPPPGLGFEYQDYLGVSIRLGSPEDFRSASYGEVKKPETINYRTFRPEKDGLFCERIFGPERDFECHCGKYRGQKHMGIVCDKCGVMVTTSRERRKRMGHISLAAPVAHIWFFSVTPSRIGNLLGMKKTELERVIYFQDYVVVDPGESDFHVCQLITEDEYRRARAQYGTSFHAGMGAEAIGELLRGLNLDTLAVKLREEMKSCSSRQRLADIIKRLRTVEMLKDSPNDPAWMVLDVIPVIPPELRPLVRLDSGNFASSDLNDLYRRLINRNNRLKRLIELNAPEVIIRNEKRMLQQSVDALFDNGRCKRQVMSTSNQPLKSLTDMIKGKQGRFRLNLLGKRVDYSARSVIVVGPELKLHQCGLPKVIALELFQPFIIRRLKELKLAETIKAAKKMLERRDEEVWDILEEVIQGHPVLLNRAPTLHRMGIQAFEPVLIEGNAIQLHPLVCPAFNADFDGDQMAVHLPLSYEAQIEASTLMLSSNNIFSPSNGQPLISPHQDIILGLFFLTADKDECRNAWAAQQRGGVYASLDELMLAYSHGHLETHSKVMLRFPAGSFLADEYGKPFRRLRRDELLITTPGRAISNDVLPPGMPYYNFAWHKKAIHDLIHDCHRLCGRAATLELLDDLKALGFKGATRSGMSFAKDDMLIPRSKWEIIERTQQLVDQVQRDFAEGAITNNERYSKIIDHWTTAREEISTALMVELASDRRDGRPYLNPVFVMAHSGARGGVDQIRQLAGMRGLMAKPSGEIIETPIRANFREGLRVLEYFSSTHGARKGLADTALKTADSGYLTRKLADVAQNVVAAGYDCGTLNGLPKSAVYTGDKLALPLAKVIRGRVACDTIRDRITDELVIQAGELITADVAERIEEMGYNKIRVRSPLTCEAGTGVCRLCYGEDLARGRLVEEGLAVGIIAAQSIGEPGTQLTMRTFHIGGTASRDVVESSRKSKRGGVAEYSELRTVTSPEGREVVLSRTGSLIIRDNKGRELDRHEVRAGAVMAVKNGDKVAKGQKLFEWDPHFVPILAEYNGRVRFADVVEGKTMVVEEDLKTKVKRYKIVESKGDLHPQILLVDKDKDDEVLYYTALPENAYLEVDDGQLVTAGTMLAKSPPAVGGTQDITGGLPRVTELFEARIPKDPATMAEIDGVVELGEKRRGKRIIKVKDPETGETREHTVSQSKHLRVHTGDKVKAGQPLVDGPLPPQEILQIKGEDELQRYLVDEVQKVYRAQGVTISDKHIEIIVMQMLRKVQVDAAGDSKLLPNSLIDRHAFRRIVDEAVAEGKNPPVAQPMIMGITKASVQSDSFISAASFQETTKVLTEAALKGKLDHLLGLKENVILGNLIPAGTGCRELLHTRIKKTVDFSQFAELAPGRPDGAEAVAEAAR